MNETVPLSSNSSRAFANVEGECFSSLNADGVAYRIGGGDLEDRLLVGLRG